MTYEFFILISYKVKTKKKEFRSTYPITTRLAPPLLLGGTEGFGKVLAKSVAKSMSTASAVTFRTGFLGSLGGAIFPPLIAVDILPDFPAKTFWFGLLLFSFSAFADDRGRGIGSSLTFSFPFPWIVGFFNVWIRMENSCLSRLKIRNRREFDKGTTFMTRRLTSCNLSCRFWGVGSASLRFVDLDDAFFDLASS